MNSKIIKSGTFGEVLVMSMTEKPMLVVAWQDHENKLKMLEFEFPSTPQGWSTLDKSFIHARDDNIDDLIGE